MKRALKIVLYTLLMFLLMLLLLVYFFLNTETGARYAIKILPRFVAGLTIKRSTGTLGRKFLLEYVDYKTKSFHITAEKVEIVWSPWRWFNKSGLVKELRVNELNIYLLPEDTREESHASKQQKRNWFKYNYFAHTEIHHLNLYYDNQFKGSLEQVSARLQKDGSHQVTILLKKGRVDATVLAHVGEVLTWNARIRATNVDTSTLWKNSSAVVSFNLNSSGEWGDQNRIVSLALTNLTGESHARPISGQANLIYKNGALNIQLFDFMFADSTIKISGVTGDEWHLNWAIDIKDFSKIYKNFSGRLNSQGRIVTEKQRQIMSGRLNASNLKFGAYRIAKVSGTLYSPLQWQAPANLQLQIEQVKYNSYFIPKINTNLFIRRVANTLQAVGSLDLLHGNKAQVNFGFLNFFNQYDGSVRGRINFYFATLPNVLKNNYFKNLTGNLRAELNVSGKLDQLKIAGLAALQNASVSIPQLGVRLQQINVQSRFNAANAGTISGEFRSGAGMGHISGTYDLTQNDYAAKLFIKGENLQAANLRQYKVIASPDLMMTFADNIPTISGSVYLPHIKVEAESYSRAVTLPNEVVFVGQASPINYFANLALRLRVVLGEDVSIAYKDLRATLAGSLFIFQLPGGMPAANGELVIKKGIYKVYDKLFSIDGGRLVYVGNLLTDPGLSIHAKRILQPEQKTFLGFSLSTSNVSSVDVGVSIQGTLDDPIINLYSTPMMSQDDILSYIVFGQPRSQINSASALTLLGAVTSNMNLEGPSMGDGANPASGIFGIFKMGFFNPAQVLNFSFPITKHWELRTEAGIYDTGVDLLYNYEADSLF